MGFVDLPKRILKESKRHDKILWEPWDIYIDEMDAKILFQPRFTVSYIPQNVLNSLKNSITSVITPGKLTFPVAKLP